jgi:7,8-dihydro-6-hydroxymethylpterin-pyrophosphokinase
MENPDQPRFLNIVCRAATTLAPHDLLALAKGIEAKMGRLPARPNSPRPIDIDILLYGDKKIKTPDLVIPHPKMAKRMFVLLPLAEIAPGLKHPVNKLTVEEMMARIKKDQGVVRLGDDTGDGGEVCEGQTEKSRKRARCCLDYLAKKQESLKGGRKPLSKRISSSPDRRGGLRG